MNLLFICPTNPRFMPYLDNYLKVTGDNDVELLIWDRFCVEEENEKKIIFRKGPEQHQRGVFDYYKFGRFIINILKEKMFDRIVCFGLQTAFFIRGFLLEKYSGKYILDVRDHNAIAKFYNFSSIINKSAYSVVSSLGYLSWLPPSNKYLLNHNAGFKDLSMCANVLTHDSERKIIVSSIGALRDLKINIDFIKSINSNKSLYLFYHGKGDINTQLEKAVLGADYVELTGYYQKDEERELYLSSDIINVLRYADGINNITALPNRLYLAPYYGKPLLAYSGTYLADIIEKYNIGLVLNSFNDVSKQILKYFEKFSTDDFESKRRVFLDNVIKENNEFELKVSLFFSN